MSTKHALLAIGTALIAVLAIETDAAACGGCFSPPETTTVVTDHRMIFSISKTQSTLYDQIQYTGSPSSFGWVLPYSGEIEVGISSDIVFSVLDRSTQVAILPPPRTCPPPPSVCNGSSGGSGGLSAGAAAPENGVTVLKRDVVGPYETAQLSATNPTALNDWLGKNGYAIPNDVKPVIAAYQAQSFNFLALKLVPGKGVQDMRPVRVTTKGAGVALPLRMVAAGTGAKVGITLWVIGEGRYEPKNFGSFLIKETDLTWDWAQNKSDYIDLRAAKNTAGAGKVWEIESSTTIPRAQIFQQVQSQALSQGNGQGQGQGDAYLPVETDAGTKTALEVEAEDLATLFRGIPDGVERITRMRSDLVRAGLATDLELKAAADQSTVATTRNVSKAKGSPPCPDYSYCNGPSASGGTTSSSSGTGTSAGPPPEDDGCATTNKKSSSPLVAIALAVLGIVASRAIRRKRP